MLNFLKGLYENQQEAVAKLYVTSNFSVYDLQSELRAFYGNISSEPLHFKKINKGFTVDVDSTTNQKKQIITSTRLQFLQNKTVIYVMATQVTIDLSSYQETKKTASIDLQKQVFFKHLQTFLLDLQNDHLYALNNTEQLPFVTSVDLETQNFIFHQLTPKEVVLSILGATDIRLKATEKKLSVGYFVLTAERSFLVGKDAEKNVFLVNVPSESFTILEKTGKDLITTENLSFYTEFMNDTLYRELAPVIATKGNRLGVFGDLIAKKYHKKEAHLALASRLFQLQSTTVAIISNELKAELIPQVKRQKIALEHQETLQHIFEKYVATHEFFGDDLIHIVKDWELSFTEQKKLLQVLQPFQRSETAKHTLAFHTFVYEQFIAQEKKETSVFEFNLNYAKHLTNARAFSEAIKVYRTIYSTLPDDSITDLLPTKTVNILAGEGGRTLKISILESILKIQQELQEDVSKTVHQLAILQPLLQPRLQALAMHKNFQTKAQTIQEILHAKQLTTATVTHTNTYNPVAKKELLQKVVPSCFQEAKGFFDSLNNFIAALNPPDYEAVISFSDRLQTENYPEILQRIIAMCEALQMEVPECYIGRGKYANSLIGVEGSPSFLIIGIDFLHRESIRYLEINALTFLIATELAHIYFEHSKITATDVWRGAADKGFSVLNVLLTILPFAGNIGTLFGNASNVEKYGNILKRVEQVANAAEKGKEIKEVSDKYNFNPFSKSKSSENDSQNLLITSRLMEMVADKVALLFCDDLKAAAKGLLAGKKLYEEYHTDITTQGVQAFLAQTNSEKEFIHQELIIRLKSLCTFYLSDTFETLKEQLYAS
jgi:hypothetical protein